MNDSSVYRPRVILYDWDNTLVDSWPVIHAANNAVHRHFRRPEYTTVEETRQQARLSLREVYPKLYGNRWEEARDIFYAAFEASHLQEIRPVQGANELLSVVSGQGVPQAVVSNKVGEYLRREVTHLGWEPYFFAVVGAGDAARDKPAPEPVWLALDGLSVDVGPEIWFVGDSDVDMQIAHATGSTAVLIDPDPDWNGVFLDSRPQIHFPNLTAFHNFLTAGQGYI